MTRIIKRAESARASETAGVAVPRATVVRGEVAEARAEAQAIRERAAAEAAETLETARREADGVREEARRRGYDEGRAQGSAELVELVAGASRRLADIEQQAIGQLRDLAIGIARKILGAELGLRPEAVVELVKQALADKARLRREVVLRVHPDDLAVVREHQPELLAVLGRARELGLREDPEVARHGVVIETEAGTIDAQLETQLAVLERVLARVR